MAKIIYKNLRQERTVLRVFVFILVSAWLTMTCFAQSGNSYIFPGVGLGAIASGTRRITDEMFMGAALALALLVSEADLAQGSLYPALPRIREVSAQIAAKVAEVAYTRRLASGQAPHDVLAHVKSHMYAPRYCSYA